MTVKKLREELLYLYRELESSELKNPDMEILTGYPHHNYDVPLKDIYILHERYLDDEYQCSDSCKKDSDGDCIEEHYLEYINLVVEYEK